MLRQAITILQNGANPHQLKADLVEAEKSLTSLKASQAASKGGCARGALVKRNFQESFVDELKITSMSQNWHTKVTADAAAERKVFKTYAQCKEFGQREKEK